MKHNLIKIVLVTLLLVLSNSLFAQYYYGMAGFHSLGMNPDLFAASDEALVEFEQGLINQNEVAFGMDQQFSVSLGIAFAENQKDFYERLYGGIEIAGFAFGLETGSIRGSLPAASVSVWATTTPGDVFEGDYLVFDGGMFIEDIAGARFGVMAANINMPTKFQINEGPDVQIFDTGFSNQAYGIFIEANTLRSLVIDEYPGLPLVELVEEDDMQIYIGWSTKAMVGIARGEHSDAFVSTYLNAVDKPHEETLWGVSALAFYKLELVGAFRDVADVKGLDIGFSAGFDGRLYLFEYFMTEYTINGLSYYTQAADAPASIGPYIQFALKY